MSKLFNFFKKLFQGAPKEIEEEIVKKEKLKRDYDKEPGEIKRSYTDELGNYARIRTAHDGEELWRFRSTGPAAGPVVREINAPAADFKTVKKFVNYIKEEIGKV